MARGEMATFGMVEVVVMMMMLMAVRVAGNFKVEENSLAVMSPESLKGTYQSAIGNFGVPKYGGTLSGLVVYPAVNLKGCDNFPNDYFRAKSGERPNFPIIDRGECYFATKVWNAQLAGAAAVLVADNKQEELLTMDSPEEDPVASKYLQNISIPSALIAKDFGDKLKKALANKDQVSIKLDWRESLPHPDERVEYEFWTNSNDECGPQCDAQVKFVHSFRGIAQILERGGYTQFTPHYITWYCPQAFVESKQCKAQCINNGRYCAPDPEQDMSKGYDGKQVVTENLRALCVFKVSNESIPHRPWKWWDYVTDYQIRCRMQDKNYGPKCAEEVIKSLSIDVEEVRKCMGNPDVDEVNEILKKEQVTQVGTGIRGDVTILPTLVINQRQYRGILDKTAVLRAICSGYEETTDPPICLSEKIETNECEDNNGGCWQSGSITACKDTFRGRVCECPLVSGVQFEGDGYTHCEAIGRERCKVQNGGCWEETRDGVSHSACHHYRRRGCHCPRGFEGNGTAVDGCVDIDECARKLRCSCPQCKCKNTWGHYHCKCSGGLLYFYAQDTCINRKGPQSKTGWTVPLIILAGLSVVGLGSYVLYRYRVRSYMDSEIRAIMAQYMPLDSQGDVQNHLNDSNNDI